MLLHRGTLQPPKTYPHAPSNPPCAIPTDPPASAREVPKQSSLCTSCEIEIWTPSLFSQLRSLPLEEERFIKRYETRVSTIKDGVNDGCAWCIKLADGINGSVFLNAVYREWGHSEEWPEDEGSDDYQDKLESPNEEDSSDDGHGDVSQSKEEEKEMVNENARPIPSESGSDACEDEEEDGQWHSYSTGDILSFDAALSISLSFERGEKAQFTFLNVRIEATDREENNEVRRLRGDDEVVLRWRINMVGQGLTSAYSVKVYGLR